MSDVRIFVGFKQGDFNKGDSKLRPLIGVEVKKRPLPEVVMYERCGRRNRVFHRASRHGVVVSRAEVRRLFCLRSQIPFVKDSVRLLPVLQVLREQGSRGKVFSTLPLARLRMLPF